MATHPVRSTRQWTVSTDNGIAVQGYLPDWAEADPSTAGVLPGHLQAALADVALRKSFPGVAVLAFTSGGGAQRAHPVEVLHGEIQCHPYADPHFPDDAVIPIVNVQISPDCWLADLDPAQLTSLIGKLRTHADHLEGKVLPDLVAARKDWAARHPERAKPRP